MKTRILAMLLVVMMVVALVPANVFAAEAAPALPEAEATVTGRDITVMTMDGEEVPVTFTMNFKAVEPNDEQYAYYKKWYADYVLTVNKDVTGMDGYLVGQYDQADADWIKIAVETEDVVIKANEPFKVMYNLGQMINEKSTYISYEDIINYVQDFDCGIYFTPEFLQANPDLEVTLELRIYNLHDMEENYRIGDAYVFTPDTKPVLPEAIATVTGQDTTVTVMGGEQVPATFTMNFKAVAPSQAQYAYYGNWYADYVLTVNKDVKGTDAYLVGQYDAFNADWVQVGVDTDEVIIKANEPMNVMYTLGKMINENSTFIAYKDIVDFIQEFDCGIYFTPEYLKSNPDLEVTLELKLYNPKNMEENYRIGNAYTFTAEKPAMVASVNGKEYATLAEAWQNANGQTVTLLTDATATSLLKVANGQTITLELNGCTITAENGRNYILSVENGGKLTINDATGNGGVVNNNTYGYAIVNKGELVVNGGNFVGDYALYNGDYALTASATLNGGTFAANEGAFYSVANCSELIVAGATLNDWVNTSAKFTLESGKVENLYIGVADKAVASEVANMLNGGEVVALYVEDATCPVTKGEGVTVVTPEGFCWNAENALGAHEVTFVVTEATCTKAGYTTYTCAHCGVTEVADKVAKLGHDYQEETIEGGTKYTCSRCDLEFVITAQPVDATVAMGKEATFTVVAADAVSYQWQRIKTGATAWTNITGATEASYTCTVSSTTILPYRCVLTDAAGNQFITKEVTVVEPDPLVNVTNQPDNTKVIKNTPISFTVELDSTEGVTYQWQRYKGGSWRNVSYSGNQTETVTFAATSWGQYPFRCEITDANGTKIYTGEYTYDLYEPPVNPSIVKNPKDVYVINGGIATFAVEAVGSSFIEDGSVDTGVTYQWWRSRDNGATWGEYTAADAQTASISLKVYSGQEYLYMCEVKDGYGNTLKTKVVQPHLITPVKITSQPTVVVEDGKATFSFTATGDVRTYQWERLKSNGWVNANSSSYEGFNTTTMSTTVTGTFRCRITDLAGNVTYTNEVTFTK